METGIVSFVSNEQGFNCISSLQVAEIFNREHKNVLQQIDVLITSGDLEDGWNCQPSSYQNDQNKPQPMYLLTDVGFALLVASFRLKDGEGKALRSKILHLFCATRELELKSHQAIKAQAELLIAADKQRKFRKKNPLHGYVLEWIEGDEFPDVVRVLRENHTEYDLNEGEIAHNEYIQYGLGKKNKKLEQLNLDILNAMKKEGN